MLDFKKILVCAPTAAAKNYCFDAWLENVMGFTYPNFIIRLFDNTEDHGANARLLNQKYIDIYGDDGRFVCLNSLEVNKVKQMPSVIERMALSHNDGRLYALRNNFDYILHLETDVFPEKDVIERLMFSRKPVIGAIYYRDEGISRKPTLQRNIFYTPVNVGSLNFEPFEDLNFIDGTVKDVAACGLGCVLISRPVLAKVPFRSVEGRGFHPDSYFSEDCFREKFQISVDTSLICKHENRQWGQFGVDFK